MKSEIWKLTGAGIISLGTLIVIATAQEPSVEKVAVEIDGDKSTAIAPSDIEKAPVVQIALLLDTSGSMSGLIAQAKTQLWSVVNEFIVAKQGGKTPAVQVALFEYGKSSLSDDSRWIRQIQPLTRDLDTISKELFALSTNGGEEYCGAVIEQAVTTLTWETSPETYKAIFIAGNEAFTQGPIAAPAACKTAISKGIIVNTIHCGEESAGIAGGWKEGALLADGSFMVIDQNQAVAHIEAPQDDQIVKLNGELNKTYIAFGKQRQAWAENQFAQDSNAFGVNKANLVSRAATKASSLYCNAHWDIVDACQQKDFKWTDIKKEDLPEELRKLSIEELKAHVETQLTCRQQLQTQILKLTQERDSWVGAKRKELGEDNSLGQAVSSAIRGQAEMKGISFGVE
ncbi:MAG: hypothetical protein ACI9R3_006106 [Verrucomicrobiales bacterium]|jgi:hypothetical protein